MDHQIKETQQDAQSRSRDSVGGGGDKQVGHHKLYGLVREVIGEQVSSSPSLAQPSTIPIGRVLLMEAERVCKRTDVRVLLVEAVRVCKRTDVRVLLVEAERVCKRSCNRCCTQTQICLMPR